MKVKILIALVLLLCSANSALTQTTEFTFQSRLVDSSIPANASYDFEFRLFSVETGGAAIATNQRLGVAVSNGIFTVKLDFGGNFNGQPRWLEIAVRQAGSPNPLTVLTPRQAVSSAPYAIRSLNSANADNALNATNAVNATTAINSLQLGGTAANQFVQTNDSRLSDARNPLPGSQNYIQNTGIIQNGDFNIDGDGVANLFDARAQFNINGNRVLGIGGSASTFAGIGAGTNSTGDSNSFFGRSAGGGLTNSGSGNSFFGERSGALNTTGFGNSFFGSAAGVNNTSGRTNSFFGSQSGQSNTTGVDNSFFGVQAGFNTTTGSNNSFFGRGAGVLNTAGENSFFGALAGAANTNGTFNSFFGYRSGNSNTTGISNSFFGWDAGRGNVDGCCNTFMGVQAGQFNTSGTRNVFIGHDTGNLNTTGSNNTLIGYSAGVGANNLTFATAIGAQASVLTSNTIALGRTNGSDRVLVPGILNVTADIDAEPGSGGSIVVGLTTSTNVAIDKNEIMARSNGAVSTLALNADGGDVNLIQSGFGFVGIGTGNPVAKLDVNGTIAVRELAGSGSVDVCRSSLDVLANCSSSLRYKTDVQSFFGGLAVVRRLRPITFSWREGGVRDIGFGAEEVERIEPLLTTRNEKGEIEGVKYKQITTVLVNAVNEQQTEIEQLQKQIETQNKLLIAQQRQIDALKKLVCASNPNAEICREEQP